MAASVKSITDIWTSFNHRSLRDVLEELSESEVRKPKSFVVLRRRSGNHWNKIGVGEDRDYMKAFSAKTLEKCKVWVTDDAIKISCEYPGLMRPRGIVSSEGPDSATYIVGEPNFMLDYLVEPVGGVK